VSAMDARIESVVTACFGQLMDLDPARVDRDARLDDVYKVSSFNRMWLVNELERELGIDIPAEEGQAVFTLNDLIALCERRAAARVAE